MIWALCLLSHLWQPVQARPAPGPGSSPSSSNVVCTSTKGNFTIEMHPEWAPIGGERFLSLVADGAFDGTVIYRVVRKGDGSPEAVQFGHLKDPELARKWKHNLKDDPQIFHEPNFHRGMISFAGGGANTRSTDVFITFLTGDANGRPGAPWETPFGIIDDAGLTTVGAFGGVGDLAMAGGNAPDLGLGYDALKTSHPDIDYLGTCTLVPVPTASAAPPLHPHAAVLPPNSKTGNHPDQHQHHHRHDQQQTEQARGGAANPGGGLGLWQQLGPQLQWLLVGSLLVTGNLGIWWRLYGRHMGGKIE